jgi:hypothetical protein
VADVLSALGIADTDLTAAVDGELAERHTPLHDGAELVLLVAMEGGAEAAGEATIRKAAKGICSKPGKPQKAFAVNQESRKRHLQ